MEAAARGAAAAGTVITAVTLAEKEAWGPFNPHVNAAIYAPTMGARLHAYLDDADLVVAMGGGVGTLHELAAAIYYVGNIRPIPVRLIGPAAGRLHDLLVQDRWLIETPTRPLGFLRCLADADALAADLNQPATPDPPGAGER
jgi:predicted Rossmann-fold nucleotide-binding protein